MPDSSPLEKRLASHSWSLSSFLKQIWKVRVGVNCVFVDFSAVGNCGHLHLLYHFAICTSISARSRYPWSLCLLRGDRNFCVSTWIVDKSISTRRSQVSICKSYHSPIEQDHNRLSLWDWGQFRAIQFHLTQKSDVPFKKRTSLIRTSDLHILTQLPNPTGYQLNKLIHMRVPDLGHRGQVKS